MEHVEVDSIFSLKFHEITKLSAHISVMRVHKGFIYMYFVKDGPSGSGRISGTEFVPCERFIPEDKTVYKNCVNFNDGDQPQWDYKWDKQDAGARCEYHHQFFHVVNESIIPNCNECKIFKPKTQPPPATRTIPEGFIG